MRILAMYLPQYHEIKENNEWWGEGYTEWNAVKNAKPLFQSHDQPRKPLNNNYYDLVKNGVETWKWQADMAKDYGVYGFCIYHYWFEGKQLLEKPMEILRDHPEIDIRYCICWANETWRRTWYGQEKQILMEQTYGDKAAWRQHFEYLLTFFKDSRYIKIENKPVLNIYQSSDIVELPQMLMLWNELAMKEGFSGIYLVSAMTAKGEDKRDSLFDAYYCFEPGYTLKQDLDMVETGRYLLRTGLCRINNKISKKKIVEHIIDTRMIYRHIETRELSEKCYPGTFPQWDNTPRTGTMGLHYKHTSPKLYQEHLKLLFDKYWESKEFIYINAWNEWGEGAYLEPDEACGYGYLEAMRAVNEIFSESIQ